MDRTQIFVGGQRFNAKGHREIGRGEQVIKLFFILNVVYEIHNCIHLSKLIKLYAKRSEFYNT